MLAASVVFTGVPTFSITLLAASIFPAGFNFRSPDEVDIVCASASPNFILVALPADSSGLENGSVFCLRFVFLEEDDFEVEK